ncbi:HAD-IIIA family hydrolase [Gracilibacillus salitolerans]|uniref:D,D-heptose 1,7-bisphosphate phosphatase n=1 Tax=Gracilibacillus salitolerans TaxID=2663022 RepID=A0A5Q2TPM5_9BACI|nr:HAD-IIIA family hydrolase [Gracilibacillus salitolerans]QGH36695.1 HAD-IIIA family hydrolase [Gracilibacillus salitolerans]
MKVAFFDRDGTIIEDYPDHEWSSLEYPVFLEGAVNTLKEVTRKGYKIIIITNQYIINEGYITMDQYHHITNQMICELKRQNIEIHDIYFCPHGKSEGCNCIKPNTGMIEQAMQKYPEINLEESFMIGDSVEDLRLAINMEIKGFGIGIDVEFQEDNIYQLKTVKDLPSYI